MPTSRVTALELQKFTDDLGVDCLAYRGETYIIGRWTLGVATGKTSFEPSKQRSIPKDATERQQADYRHANGLLYIKPRFCFDAWVGARKELADVLALEHKLETEGYSDQALRDTLNKVLGTAALARLEFSIDKIYRMHQEAAILYEKLSTDFGGFGETEARAAVYDLALVEKFNAMTLIERSVWGHLIKREDGAIDRRMLAALFRSPRALHNLSDQDMRDLQVAYFRGEWPQTASAVTVLNQAVLAAHDGLRAAANLIGERCGVGRAGVAAVMGDADDWLQADFNSVLSMTSVDYV